MSEPAPSAKSAELRSLSASELVSAMRSKQLKLPFEVGTFIALEASEIALEAACLALPSEVLLTTDGLVSIAPSAQKVGHKAAAQSLCRDLLGHLMVASASAIPPSILSLVEEGPSSGDWSLSRLHDELEASLIPLNRSAIRRVLMRLVRDAQKAPLPQRARPSQVDEEDADADLDAFLATELPDDGDGDDVDLILESEETPFDEDGNPIVDFQEVAQKRAPGSPSAKLAPPSPKKAPPPPKKVAPTVAAPPEPGTVPETAPPQPETALPEIALPVTPATITEDVSPPKTRFSTWLMLLLTAVACAFIGVALFRPAWLEQMLGRTNAATSSARSATSEHEAIAPATRRGDLVVDAHDPRAQIYLYEGRAPLTIDRLPIGIAYELLVIGEGRDAIRETIPHDAEWEEGKLKRRVQVAETPVPLERLQLGESRLSAETMGTPSDALGALTIQSEPEGARVFLLVGFGRAELRDLAIDQAQELWIYEAQRGLMRRVVGPSDWAEAEGTWRATIEVAPEATSEVSGEASGEATTEATSEASATTAAP